MFSSEQQVLVGGVAGQDQRVPQRLGCAARLVGIALDQLDLDAVLECLREAEADVAGARNDDTPHARLLGRENSFMTSFMSSRAARKKISSCSSIVVSPSGSMLPAAAVDRRDADLAVGNVGAQRLQLVADELAALQRAHADEKHAPIRELEHLQGARVADQALDVVGDELLRADREVHGIAFSPKSSGRP
jgi:hypothetical protein